MALCQRACRIGALLPLGPAALLRQQTNAAPRCRRAARPVLSGWIGLRCSVQQEKSGEPERRSRSVRNSLGPATWGFMKPQLEVVGEAIQTVQVGIGSKVESMSRTMRVRELWQLTLSLVRNLGFGYKWTVALMQLVAYATFLLPGFTQIGFGYFFAWKVKKGIRYGTKPRNFLDLYLPPQDNRQPNGHAAPVVLFVTGGAWIIGYQAWGALLARRLSLRGAVVCCIDYRNFPQGTIGDMLQDCDTAIQWASDHVHHYGGDPDDMYIVGQSAGAHISSLCLFAQAQKTAQTQAAIPDQIRVLGPEGFELNPADRLSNSPVADQTRKGQPDWLPEQDGREAAEVEQPLLQVHRHERQATWQAAPEAVTTPAPPPAVPDLGAAARSWRLASVRGFYGISGAYDLSMLVDVMAKRGLNRSLLERMMNVKAHGSFDRVSPTQVLAGLHPAARAQLPPFQILHGSSDRSVPPVIAEEFASELQAAGLLTGLEMRPGKSHTEVFIEDPFRGDDYMCDGLSAMIFGEKPAVQYTPLVFGWLVTAASFLCPF